jgi:putative ABC transport system ATP-binding protein
VVELVPAIVALQGVTKVYGSDPAAVRALAGVDVAIEEGAFVASMGGLGIGQGDGDENHRLSRFADRRRQRTLLRRHFLGFVFQGFNLLARITALENVELRLFGAGRCGLRLCPHPPCGPARSERSTAPRVADPVWPSR